MFSFSKFEHSYDIPHLRYREPLSSEFTVKVNGTDVPVYTCRISMDDHYPEGTDFGNGENGGVHDVTFNDITVYYDEGVPMKENGDFNIKARIKSTRDGIEFYNISVPDINVIYRGKASRIKASILEG